MNKWCQILWLIFKRELYPAGDNTGLKQWASYQLPVFYLPVFGIALFLILVAFCGLFLVNAEINLNKRMEEFKSSPLTAFFGKGNFHTPGGYSKGGENYLNLLHWEKIKIKEVLGFSKLDEKGNEMNLFSSVKGLADIRLSVVKKNSAFFLPDRRGVGLPFQGEHIDKPLIDYIKESIHDKDKDRLFKYGEGIIVSQQAMAALGWSDPEEYPDFLNVRLDYFKKRVNQKEKRSYIPIRLYTPKTRLPYNFHYIISMKQLGMLEDRYYYDEIDSFSIILMNEYSGVRVEDLEKVLPKDSDIEPMRTEGKKSFEVYLLQPSTIIDILKRFTYEKKFGRDITFEFTNYNKKQSQGYMYAIFHLNYNLPDNFIWNKEHIYAINSFMEDKGVKVEGELVEMISEMLTTQRHLSKMQNMFGWSYIPVVLILIFIFYVVLHSRMHRIGAQIMLGTPANVFIAAYSLLGFALVNVTFLIAILFQIMDFHFSLSVLQLYIMILIVTEIGILLPVLYFLKFLQPSEMMAYQT